MHDAIVWLCIASGAFVFAFMLYSVATYRAPRGGAQARYRPRPFVELLWAVIPILIVVFAAMPTLRQLMAPGVPVVAAQE